MNQLNETRCEVQYRNLSVLVQEGHIPIIRLKYGPDNIDSVSLLEIAPSKVRVSVNDASLNALKTKALINALQVALQLLPDFYLIISLKQRYFENAA
jgi:hypothetical protein